jgi:tetratricopeptide (TPR) repeat protein
LQQAVQKAHLLEQPLTLAKALGLLAQLQTTLGSPQEAVTTFQQALELTAALQHAGRTPLAHGLALALQDAGQLQEAAELYERVLENGARDELAPEEHGLAMANAWRLALQQGKLERAAELRQRLEALFAKARGGDRTKTSTPPSPCSSSAQRTRRRAHERMLDERARNRLPATSRPLTGFGALPSRAALGSRFADRSHGGAAKELPDVGDAPRQERVGKWCFAGKSPSFAEALKTLDAFAEAAQIRRSGTLLADMLANDQMDFAGHARSAWSYESLPLDSIGPHTLVFLAEGGAPYDDFAVCLLEVPSFTGAPIARRKPRIPRHKQ